MIGCESNNVKVAMLLFKILDLFLRLFFKLFPDKFVGLKFSFECCPVVRESVLYLLMLMLLLLLLLLLFRWWWPRNICRSGSRIRSSACLRRASPQGWQSGQPQQSPMDQIYKG